MQKPLERIPIQTHFMVPFLNIKIRLCAVMLWLHVYSYNLNTVFALDMLPLESKSILTHIHHPTLR